MAKQPGGPIIRSLAAVSIPPMEEKAAALIPYVMLDPKPLPRPTIKHGIEAARADVRLSAPGHAVRLTFNVQVLAGGQSNALLAALFEDDREDCAHVHVIPGLSRVGHEAAPSALGFVFQHRPGRQAVTYSVRIGVDHGGLRIFSGFEGVSAGALLIDEICSED